MNSPFERYVALLKQKGLKKSPGNLRFYLRLLFGGINFKDKNVLDIGGGSGLFTFYAASQGARKVICLEPEEAGSTQKISDKFLELKSALGFDSTSILSKTLQDYDPGKEKYDVIILHNSINHLDEDACVTLHENETSREVYQKIFQKIFHLTQSKGHLIICDCSNRNFFEDLGLKNPLAPTIDWKKHQAPGIWINLLEKTGFQEKKVKWTTWNRLRAPGQWLFGNAFIAYFLRSHFCITMQKRSS